MLDVAVTVNSVPLSIDVALLLVDQLDLKFISFDDFNLNRYLGKRHVDVIIGNDGKISKEIKEKYETLEQKDEVIFDKENLEKMNLEIISNDYVDISDEIIRHKIDKLSLDIFAFLIR